MSETHKKTTLMKKKCLLWNITQYYILRAYLSISMHNALMLHAIDLSALKMCAFCKYRLPGSFSLIIEWTGVCVCVCLDNIWTLNRCNSFANSSHVVYIGDILYSIAILSLFAQPSVFKLSLAPFHSLFSFGCRCCCWR